MLRSSLVTALLLVAATDAGAQRLTGAHPDARVPWPVALANQHQFLGAFSRVGDDVFIAGQPNEAALRALRDSGVTTVVDLRVPRERSGRPYDEPALAKSLGMRYVNLPVDGTAEHPYAPETLRRFAEAMAATNGRLLLHCTVAWRASHLWAAYLIADRHVAVDSALAQTRLVSLMDDMDHGAYAQPIEGFLGRKVPELRHPSGR